MNLFLSLLGIFRELCLYFATFGMMIANDSIQYSLAVVAIVLVVAALCIVNSQKPIRFIFLPALALLFLPRLSGGHLSVFLPIGLMVIRCLYRQWEFTYDFTMTELKVGCAVYLVFAIIAFGAGGYGHMNGSLIWFCLYLAMSVFCLRVLRDEKGDVFDIPYMLMNGAVCICLCAVVLLFITPMSQMLVGNILKGIYRTLILPVLNGLLGILYGIVLVMAVVVNWIVSLFHPDITVEFPDVDMTMADGEMLVENGTVNQPAAVHVMWNVLLIAGILLFSVLVVRYMKKKSVVTIHPGGGFVQSRITSPSHRKRNSKEVHSEVRRAYRRYLKECAKHSIPVDGTMPSSVIAAETDRQIQSEAGEKLRQYWLPVRYGEKKEENTANAVALAKEISKKLKEL